MKPLPDHIIRPWCGTIVAFLIFSYYTSNTPWVEGRRGYTSASPNKGSSNSSHSYSPYQMWVQEDELQVELFL